MKSAPHFYYAFPHQERNPLYINSTGSIYMELRLDRIAPWIFLHWRAASIGYIQHARRGGGALYYPSVGWRKPQLHLPKALRVNWNSGNGLVAYLQVMELLLSKLRCAVVPRRAAMALGARSSRHTALYSLPGFACSIIKSRQAKHQPVACHYWGLETFKPLT